MRELPEGQFVLVLECRDCGKELNRSMPITKKQYTRATLAGPLTTGPCPNGCRSTFSDLNMNTTQRVRTAAGNETG